MDENITWNDLEIETAILLSNIQKKGWEFHFETKPYRRFETESVLLNQ